MYFVMENSVRFALNLFHNIIPVDVLNFINERINITIIDYSF